MKETVDSISSLVSKVSEAVDKLYVGVETTTEVLIKQNRIVRATSIPRPEQPAAVECALRFVKIS